MIVPVILAEREFKHFTGRVSLDDGTAPPAGKRDHRCTSEGWTVRTSPGARTGSGERLVANFDAWLHAM